MQQKELGRTGIQLPEIGLGTWKYRGGVAPIHKAIELGAFLIDTAEVYGTEGTVGEALRGRRDQVFLATKVSGEHLRRADLLRAAEESLRRLETDYIDLYQVHWPNPRVPITETMVALEELVDQRLLRFIGVSNFSVRELQEAQGALSGNPIVANQVLYSLLDREIEEDLLPYCQQNGVTVIAYSPLAEGKLTSPPSLLRGRRGMDVLEQIAGETGKSKAQVAINWCIAHEGVITIPKSDRVDRVVENCDASDWRLDPGQMTALNAAFQ